jgi:methylated-DNA-[protein]-cysteine S-methyltransferase
MNCIEMKSPVGKLVLVEDDGKLAGVYLDTYSPPEAERRSSPLLENAKAQLAEYFAGQRDDFDLPLAPKGTDFQRAVWKALTKIPFGETRSYAQIAQAIGKPHAVRAVGAANGANPIALIVPCHRVIGSDGSLTGYGGGLPRKKWLLAHESRLPLFAAPSEAGLRVR